MRRRLRDFCGRALPAAVILLAARGCAQDEAGLERRSRGLPGDDGGGGAAEAGRDAAAGLDAGDPAFTCTAAPAAAPALGGKLLFDPPDPHPGDTLVVLYKAADGHPQAGAPAMTIDATTARGTSSEASTTTAGGKGVIYYFAIPDLPLGDVCLLTRVGGAPELGGKVTVTPRPAPAPAPGVYKVTKNHQLTCQEQPAWGNELHVAVLDAQGKGVPGAVVTVRLPATTDLASIANAKDKPLPKALTMNAEGAYDDWFWWPSNESGLTNFELSVAGAASDVATEISSGWWETDPSGCRYCDPSQPINVYGHWSHRVVFRLDAQATDACVVPSDHAGQAACAATHGHIHHHPTHQACWRAR
jgi:hypothetical protein